MSQFALKFGKKTNKQIIKKNIYIYKLKQCIMRPSEAGF